MEILFEQAPRGLVINGFNCSFIASQTIKSLAMVNFYFFLFFFFLQKLLRTNEEIFISVSIKINYDIFNMPLSQRNNDSAKAENDELINAIENNCNFFSSDNFVQFRTNILLFL